MVIDHDTAMELSPTYKMLTPGQKEFCLVWLDSHDDTSVASIHRRLGCTYTKAKQWKKSEVVMRACREIALQKATIADTLGLMAHELVMKDLLKRVVDGTINASNIRNEQLRMLEGCQRRTGLDTLVTFALSQNPDGDQTASITGDLNVVGKALEQLRRA